MEASSSPADDGDVFFRLWMEKVAAVVQDSRNTSAMLREKYEEVLQALLRGNVVPSEEGCAETEEECKANRKEMGKIFYFWNSKFKALKVQGKWKLFYKLKEESSFEDQREVLPLEDIFWVLQRTHVQHGHPKGRTLHKRMEEKYGKSITRAQCIAYYRYLPAGLVNGNGSVSGYWHCRRFGHYKVQFTR